MKSVQQKSPQNFTFPGTCYLFSISTENFDFAISLQSILLLKMKKTNCGKIAENFNQNLMHADESFPWNMI